MAGDPRTRGLGATWPRGRPDVAAATDAWRVLRADRGERNWRGICRGWRVDLPLVLAVAFLAGPLLLVAPVETLAALAALFLMGRATARHTPCSFPKLALLFLTALLSLGASAYRASAQWDAAAEALERLGQTLPGTNLCDLEGTVAASPTIRTSSAVRVVRLVVDARVLSCDGREARDVRVVLYGSVNTGRGDALRGLVQLAPPELFHNAELGSPWPALARSRTLRTGSALWLEITREGLGPARLVDAARAHVRSRIEATFAPAAAPLARALVLGETDLDAEDGEAFKASGLSHLLAVSGMHLVLAALTARRLFEAILVRITVLSSRGATSAWSAAATIPLVWLYADFAGRSGSAVRAAAMLTALLVAGAFLRRPAGTRAMALSTLAIAFVDPLAIFDVSFLLSLGATAGLFAFAQPITDFLSAHAEQPSRLAASLGTTLAAMLPCAPLLAALGPSLPMGGMLANVVAVPIGELLALPLCLFHAVSSAVPWLEQGSAAAGSGALLLVRAVARATAAIPWLALQVPPPSALELAALAVLLGAAAMRVARWRLVACAMMLVIAAGEAHLRRPTRGHLTVTMLDVGQGDALFVELPSGEAMLIDAGGLVGSPVDVGERVVASVLRARRRSELRVVALSHPHPDHYGGLAAATKNVTVREFWETGEGRARSGGAVARLADDLSRRGARVRGPDSLCGTMELGGASVDVLAPCPSFDPDRGANDNSFVFRFRYGQRAFLFVGDAEHDEESLLLRGDGAARLKADVLKVGHHGSATSSTPTFLAAVGPAVALISTGVRNRFGHPRRETIEALSAVGARVFRTDRQGQIVVDTDGDSLRVRTAR